MGMRVNSRTTEHTGNLTIPANNSRSLLFIYQKTGSSEVEFGGGGGTIPLGAGDWYEPNVTPIDEVNITTTGTFVIHLAGQTL